MQNNIMLYRACLRREAIVNFRKRPVTRQPCYTYWSVTIYEFTYQLPVWDAVQPGAEQTWQAQRPLDQLSAAEERTHLPGSTSL